MGTIHPGLARMIQQWELCPCVAASLKQRCFVNGWNLCWNTIVLDSRLKCSSEYCSWPLIRGSEVHCTDIREGQPQNAVIHDRQGIKVTWNKGNNRFIINLLTQTLFGLKWAKNALVCIRLFSTMQMGTSNLSAAKWSRRNKIPHNGKQWTIQFHPLTFHPLSCCFTDLFRSYTAIKSSFFVFWRLKILTGGWIQ